MFRASFQHGGWISRTSTTRKTARWKKYLLGLRSYTLSLLPCQDSLKDPHNLKGKEYRLCIVMGECEGSEEHETENTAGAISTKYNLPHLMNDCYSDLLNLKEQRPVIFT